jgi:hypothetical protein
MIRDLRLEVVAPHVKKFNSRVQPIKWFGVSNLMFTHHFTTRQYNCRCLPFHSLTKWSACLVVILRIKYSKRCGELQLAESLESINSIFNDTVLDSNF